MGSDMSGGKGVLTRFRSSPHRWPILILATSAFALLINLISLEQGVSAVANHLLYIPIIITAYAYPRKGTLFALGISGVYLALVYGIRFPYPEDLFGGTVRFYMFVLVGVVVSYLSLRIKKEEQKYHRIFEQSYTGILLCDPVSHWIIQANQHVEDILGYSREEMAGKPVSVFFSEDDVGNLIRSCRNVVRNPLIQESHEIPARRKDGNVIQISLNMSGIPDEQGMCEYVIILLQDITERRNAEQVIRQQAAAMKASRDGMVILGTGGAIRYSNEAFFSMFRYQDARAIQSISFDGFFPPPEWKRFAEEILPVLERTGMWRGEMTGKRQDNGLFPMEISLGRIEGGGIFCIVHDISDRKKAELALQRVNRKLNLLSTITRRDINTQIFTLLGYVHITKNLEQDDKIYPYLERMESAMKVIGERIAFTGNYQDMGVSAPTWQDLNRVFLYALSHLDLGPVSRKIRLEGIVIFADPMLEKALFNLVKNTLLHAKTATEIRFTSHVTPSGLLLVYEDNGVGIPHNEKELIFSPDMRPAGSFGLFLVREILTITEITIHETGIFGSGARFEIHVPAGGYRIEESTHPGPTSENSGEDNLPAGIFPDETGVQP